MVNSSLQQAPLDHVHKKKKDETSHGERLVGHDQGHERPLVRGPRELVALLEQLDHRRVVQHREILQEQGVAVEVDASLANETKRDKTTKKQQVNKLIKM